MWMGLGTDGRVVWICPEMKTVLDGVKGILCIESVESDFSLNDIQNSVMKHCRIKQYLIGRQQLPRVPRQIYIRYHSACMSLGMYVVG